MAGTTAQVEVLRPTAAGREVEEDSCSLFFSFSVYVSYHKRGEGL